MRRLARWFLNGLTALSLLLCVMTVVLWVRSRTCHDYLSCSGASRLKLSLVNSEVGLRVAVVLDRVPSFHRKPEARSFRRHDFATFDEALAETFYIIDHIRSPLVQNPHTSTKWFAHGDGDYPGLRDVELGVPIPPDYRYASVAMPHWVALVGFALLPAMRCLLHFRPRPPLGLCPTCGYDLRASPDRCPECGAVPAKEGT